MTRPAAPASGFQQLLRNLPEAAGVVGVERIPADAKFNKQQMYAWYRFTDGLFDAVFTAQLDYLSVPSRHTTSPGTPSRSTTAT